jgi:hypothetical protein
VGEDSKARLIAADMCGMSVKMSASIRNDLAQETSPHFWETIDRGRNLHYLEQVERQQIDTFLGWLKA